MRCKSKKENVTNGGEKKKTVWKGSSYGKQVVIEQVQSKRDYETKETSTKREIKCSRERRGRRSSTRKKSDVGR